MIINEKKTKLFVINGQECDRQSLLSGEVNVNYVSEYLYLGAWKSESAVARHVVASETIVNKFAIFCARNTQVPFIYKRIVFDAAVMSSLLYASESWLTNNIKGIEKQYNKLVKCLLGVRRNTSINLCMVEAGIPPVQAVIKKKKSEPFHYVNRICSDANTRGARFLEILVMKIQ